MRRAKDFRLARHPQTSTSIVVPQSVIDRMFDNAVLDRRTGCLIYRAPNSRNPFTRAYAKLSWDGNGHIIGLHRLALIIATDAPCPDLMLSALHSCGNKRCLTPAHLRWGTDMENAADYQRIQYITRRQAQGLPVRLVVTRAPLPLPQPVPTPGAMAA